MNLMRSFMDYEFSDKFVITAFTLLFFPFVLFLRLIGGTWLVSNHHFPSLLQTSVIAAIVFSVWILLKLINRENIVLSGLEVHLLPFFAVVGLSTIFSSNVGLSAEKGVGVGAFFLLSLLVLEIRTHKHMQEGLINSLLLTTLFTTILSIYTIILTIEVYQYTVVDIITRLDLVLETFPRMPNILNLHKSISAGYYLMVLPLVIYKWDRVNSNLVKVILAIGTALSAIVFLLIQSRGALIGLLLMIICTAYLERAKIRGFLRTRPSVAVIMGFFGVAIISAGVMFIIKNRGFSVTEKNISCRLQAWQISLSIIKKYPLFGSGMETFGYQFLKSRDSEICRGILHVTHNDFLQILVNYGLAGIGALSYFFVMAWKAIKSGWKRNELICRHCLVALAGMIGMGIMTTMLYSPNIRFLTIFYLAWMIPEEKIREGANSRRFVPALLLMIILIAGGSLWTIWKIKPYYESRMAAENMDMDQASDWIKKALERDPNFSYYQQILAYVTAQDYCVNNKELDIALTEYNRSLEKINILPADHVNLASLFAYSGNYVDAIDEMEKAILLDLKNYDYYCYIGSYYHAIEDDQKATQALSECISGEPKWIDTPFWEEIGMGHEFEQQVINLAEKEIRIQGLADEDLKIGQLHYYAGDYNEAEQHLSRYIKGNGSNYQAYLFQSLIDLNSNNKSDARKYSEWALELNPRCSKCWLIKAEIAIEENDIAGAKKALDINASLGGGPQTHLLYAKLHLIEGDKNSAVDSLRLVNSINLPVGLYSHWIASRWHLEKYHLKCLPLGLSYQDYYLPVREAGILLKEYSCEDLGVYYAKAMTPDIISKNFFLEEYNKNQCEK